MYLFLYYIRKIEYNYPPLVLAGQTGNYVSGADFARIRLTGVKPLSTYTVQAFKDGVEVSSNEGQGWLPRIDGDGTGWIVAMVGTGQYKYVITFDSGDGNQNQSVVDFTKL